MSTVTVDDKYRVLLNKELRRRLGITKGQKLVVIPSSKSFTLIPLKGKHYRDSMKGFHYEEEKHEASQYLFGKGGKGRRPS